MSLKIRAEWMERFVNPQTTIDWNHSLPQNPVLEPEDREGESKWEEQQISTNQDKVCVLVKGSITVSF